MFDDDNFYRYKDVHLPSNIPRVRTRGIQNHSENEVQTGKHGIVSHQETA
jgi:hypothetical protein